MSSAFVIRDGVLVAYTQRGTEVTVPQGVQTVGEGAFKGCASIERITLPDSVHTLLPHAFKGCRRLREIRIPPGLVRVGDYAFHRCHSLREIALPPAVTSLGDCAFLFCDSLESASIPGVTALGRQAFLNASRLRALTLCAAVEPDSVHDIFTGCARLGQITLSDGSVHRLDNLVEAFAGAERYPPLVGAVLRDVFRMMEIRGGTLVKYRTNLKEVEIPESVTAVAAGCFADKRGIVAVRFPATLKSIRRAAFSGCNSLERVEFCSDAVEVLPGAFRNCTTLREVTLPDGRVHRLDGLIGSERADEPPLVKTIRRQMIADFLVVGTVLVRYRGGEQKVIVPHGVTVVGPGAFAGNEVVGRVVLPETVCTIGAEAFADCLTLQTVNLPAALTHIGPSAFENCAKLARVQLPPLLETVEKAAFSRCAKLVSLSLGAVQAIGERAFYGCRSLAGLELPGTLREIGDLAFYQCTALRSVSLPDSLKCLGSGAFALCGLVSASVQCDLERCGPDVFSRCSKLRTLTFRERVRGVGDRFAFACPELREVSLPEGLERIGKQAFAGSRHLGEIARSAAAASILLDGGALSGDVVIPEGVRAIAGGALDGNEGITSLRLPRSLSSVGPRAFCGCTALEKVLFEGGLPVLEEGVFAHCRALRSVEMGTVLPRAIHDNAFYGCESLRSAPLQEAASVGKGALHGCRAITEMPREDVAIGEDALRGTGILRGLEGPEPVTVSRTVVDGSRCSGRVTLPAGVKRIAPYAFANNTALTAITLPDSLAEIGQGAFYGCTGLCEVVFPPSGPGVEIAPQAFCKCTSLDAVTSPSRLVMEGAFAFCTGLRSARFTGIRLLHREVFRGCESLADLACAPVETVGDACFRDCRSLAAFNFSGVRAVGEEAFAGCESLTAVSLDDGTALGPRAFADCGRLTELRLAGGVRHSVDAFAGCTALQAVTAGAREYRFGGYDDLFDTAVPGAVRHLFYSAVSCFAVDEERELTGYAGSGSCVGVPAGVRGIGDEVFRDAYRLEELVVPDTVRRVGARAFAGTAWLQRQAERDPMVTLNGILVDAARCQGKAVIPASVHTVAGWAFAGCTALTGVTFLSAHTRVEPYAFRNCIHLRTVTDAAGRTFRLTGLADRDRELPAPVGRIFTECLNCFKTDPDGVLLESTGNIPRLTLAQGITAIAPGVFRDSRLLVEVTLARETAVIGAGAFEDCHWLKRVGGAQGVEVIEKRAFAGCAQLGEIELSDRLARLGPRAFEHCTALREIHIPEGVTEIPERAFFRCKGLQRLALPSTLRVIGPEAFAFCSSLRELSLPARLETVASRAFAWCTGLGDVHRPPGAAVAENAFSAEAL